MIRSILRLGWVDPGIPKFNQPFTHKFEGQASNTKADIRIYRQDMIREDWYRLIQYILICHFMFKECLETETQITQHRWINRWCVLSPGLSSNDRLYIIADHLELDTLSAVLRSKDLNNTYIKKNGSVGQYTAFLLHTLTIYRLFVCSHIWILFPISCQWILFKYIPTVLTYVFVWISTWTGCVSKDCQGMGYGCLLGSYVRRSQATLEFSLPSGYPGVAPLPSPVQSTRVLALVVRGPVVPPGAPESNDKLLAPHGVHHYFGKNWLTPANHSSKKSQFLASDGLGTGKSWLLNDIDDLMSLGLWGHHQSLRWNHHGQPWQFQGLLVRKCLGDRPVVNGFGCLPLRYWPIENAAKAMTQLHVHHAALPCKSILASMDPKSGSQLFWYCMAMTLFN